MSVDRACRACAAVQRGIRRVVPHTVRAAVPGRERARSRAVAALVPGSVAAVPLYGAAVLSVLVPLVVVRIRPALAVAERCSSTSIAFVAYTLLVVLQDPAGFGDLCARAVPRTVADPDLRAAAGQPAQSDGRSGRADLARRGDRRRVRRPPLVHAAALPRVPGRRSGSPTPRPSAPSASPLTATPSRETVLARRPARDAAADARRRRPGCVRTRPPRAPQPDGVLPLRGLRRRRRATLSSSRVLAAFAVQSSAFPKRAHDTAARPERRPVRSAHARCRSSPGCARSHPSRRDNRCSR